MSFATLGIAIVGCGGSSHKAATSAPAPTTATASTATTTTARPRPHKPVAHRKAAKTSTKASTSAPAAPPDGLRPAAGYASYDACTSGCSGSVPGSIRRPLRIPSSCQASSSHRIAGMSVLGSAPVGPAQPGTLPVSSFIGSAWLGGRVTWVAAPSYSGPILVRGRQIGGSHAVGYGEGHVPVDELQLLAPVQRSGGARQWPSFSRVLVRGCYAYQVDGTTFSSVIVFRAG